MTEYERVENIISRLDRHQCNEILRTICLCVTKEENEEEARLAVETAYYADELEAEVFYELDVD